MSAHQQCYCEVDCVQPGRGHVPREHVGRRDGPRGGRGRLGAGAIAQVGGGEQREGAEDDAEDRRDLEGVAHVDVAGRHEEREYGEQGEGQAQGCKNGGEENTDID